MAIVATLCLVAACALPPAASAAALLVACEAAFTCATTVMMWPSSGKAVAFFVARVTFSATLWLLATTCRLAGLCCQLAGRFWLVCCTSECTLVRRLRMLVVAVVVAISTHQRASGRFPRAVVSCAACVGIALLALLPAVVSALWAVTLFTQVVWLVVTMWRYGGALLVGRAPLSLHYAVTVLGAAWLLCAALAACACCFLDVSSHGTAEWVGLRFRSLWQPSCPAWWRCFARRSAAMVSFGVSWPRCRAVAHSTTRCIARACARTLPATTDCFGIARDNPLKLRARDNEIARARQRSVNLPTRIHPLGYPPARAQDKALRPVHCRSPVQL